MTNGNDSSSEAAADASAESAPAAADADAGAAGVRGASDDSPTRTLPSTAAVAIPWLLAIATVVAVRYRGQFEWVRELHFQMAVHGVPQSLRHFDTLLLYLVAAVLGALFIKRAAGGTIRQHMGWGVAARGWMWMVVAACLPMIVGGAALGIERGTFERLEMAWRSALAGVVRAPVSEELLFRGLLVAAPAAVIGWRGRWFWLNAVLAAALFGAVHLKWTSAFLSGWPSFLVTFCGGVWYAWLLARWQTLWVPIGLHAGMNLGWLLARASGGAGGGGLMENALRVATIVIATVWTIRRTRRAKEPTEST